MNEYSFIKGYNEKLYSSSSLYRFLYDDIYGNAIGPLEKSKYVRDVYKKSGMDELKTADVMTSSREYIKLFIGEGSRPGWAAQYSKLIEDIEDFSRCEESYSDFFWLTKRKGKTSNASLSFLSFIKVYNTVGNYTPSFDNKAYHFNDHWAYKIKKIQESYSTDWNDYLSKYYMSDYVNVSLGNKNFTDYDDSDWTHFFSTYSKLIIQRGYRIDKQFTGKWDRTRAKEVCEAFEAVGLPPDSDEAHGLPYTIIGEWEEAER